MNINEIRAKYLKFFSSKGGSASGGKARGHTIIPSASIVPQNDPTTLFTGSGMQPLVPYLLGQPHPKGNRLVNSQKSFRAEDIEEVGDNRHTTFFEMLGNWSLGDYFKKEQLPWFFEFLTKEIGLDPKKLYVTAFIGDEKNGVPKDTESAEIWQKLFAEKGIEAKVVEIGSEEDGYRRGMQGGRIFYYNAKKNWWSRAGVPENMPVGEPGGPDSEMFYDFGSTGSPQAVLHDPVFGKECHPNCDCGRFLEIGNSVFMQYIKKDDGTFTLLPKQNVDFGGGLERIAAAAQNNPDVFAIDVFEEAIALLIHFSGKEYNDNRYKRSFRIVADHMRAAIFMLEAGVRPANTERGYVLRRLLRRAAQHAEKLGVQDGDEGDSMLVRCAVIFIEKYKQAYPEFQSDDVYQMIKSEIWKEEKQFAHTLEAGMKEFEKLAKGGHVSGPQAYTLFTTHGFPFEMTLELAKEWGIDVDEDGFKAEMKKHQELSRAGSGQKFKGGLADTSEKTTRLHTAHHLLLKALQVVLGDHVKQRGSNITQERLRIDFSHGEKMTKEQLAEAERLVNEKIREALPVIRSTMLKTEAEQLGAQKEFGAKYADTVSVYSMGPKDATQENPQFEKAFSLEFCGGPHVSNTGELSGTFKILKEEAVASGIRRIKAVIV
ncbi:alanine--tRNA ligase [Candidatus Kaiserbacteria bacterium CG10_big_fil_rev_8_21_14_0_10_51_14]|uniref:alanine--tRNA ligase n=1 Tax=Candidatus Kaiserbacteria bacterium CG10_big_fil_rev_8_21_14_0_10_51_14 TaxID=1974610 RepID=A0A2H0UAX4_9BACT|nr:MAG: alanine--tRNA ligase [Candidatus Kaiserbacteria bacterium CG10_big_fil_rev_8_21_14_0_10_51_14]